MYLLRKYFTSQKKVSTWSRSADGRGLKQRIIKYLLLWPDLGLTVVGGAAVVATCSGRKVAVMMVILISTTNTWNQPHQNTKNLIWTMAMTTPDCLLSF